MTSDRASLAALLAAAFVMGGCERAPETHREGADPAPAARPEQRLLATTPPIEVVASGLETPWALAFPDRDRILITERGGRVRVVNGGVLQVEPWAELDVAELSEAGLHGIAISPDYARSRHVFVFGVFLSGRTLQQPRRRLFARVVRFTDRGASGTDPVVIIDDLPAGQLHAGGALGFGPDGMLYVSIGDVFDQESAQDAAALSGAILRYRPDGGVPADNPTPGSPVWAKGLRNVQGFVWHPATGDMLAVEHGPTGLTEENRRTDEDELNIIRRGGNYGWPVVTGRSQDARYDGPLAEWTPAIAPAGIAVVSGALYPRWEGSAFVTGLRGRQLRRLVLSRGESGWSVTEEESLFAGELGRLRAVGVAPDGVLYFATSNRDGRGSPAAEDDRLFRVPPGTEREQPAQQPATQN